MEKAVLVMDMPKDCFACDLESYGECKAMFGEVIENKFEKPSWCPLKPMPENKDAMTAHFATDYNYALGWNDCLDAIQGKE